MFRKDLNLENPKKFQRFLHDHISEVLFCRDYYLNGTQSVKPYLKPNGIINTSDFHGKLCYVKSHRNYNLILQGVGIVFFLLSGLLAIGGLMSTLIDTPYSDGLSLFIVSIFLGVIGVFFYFYKVGKDICIMVELIGESYRTDHKDEKTGMQEYLNVRSHARLTVQGESLDPSKSLSQEEKNTLQIDGRYVITKLDVILKDYLEKNDNE